MIPIAKLKAADLKIGATEYKLWRYPDDFFYICSLKNEYDFGNCLSHYFDYSVEELNFEWGCIAFPWINNPAPRPRQPFRYILKARPANMRHDDTFKIRAGVMFRHPQGTTTYGFQYTWLEQQRSFWDEWEEYYFNFEIEFFSPCIRPLLCISANFGSKLTRKKGVGLYFEYLTVLTEIEWEHFYIIVESQGLNYTVFYKVNLWGEKLKEKTVNEVYFLEKGVCNITGGFMAATTIYEGGNYYKLARFNDDFEIIKKVHEKEEPYPCGQCIFLYELAENTYLIPTNALYDNNNFKIVDSNFLTIKSRKAKQLPARCPDVTGIYRKDPDNFLYYIMPFGIYKQSPFPDMETIKFLHLGWDYNNYSADLGPDRIYFFGNVLGGSPWFYFVQISFDLEIINSFVFENSTYAALDVKALWVDEEERIIVIAVAPYPWAGREKGVYILTLHKEGVVIADEKLNFIPDDLDLTHVKVYTLPLWGG